MERTMIHKIFILLLVLIGAGLLLFRGDVFSSVIRENEKIYIVDRTGYQWDITQAVSLGFEPEGFQYGIGKDAFTPLDEKEVKEENSRVFPFLRVIGITEGTEAKAFSVPKLSRHEIANSEIDSQPIAAAY